MHTISCDSVTLNIQRGDTLSWRRHCERRHFHAVIFALGVLFVPNLQAESASKQDTPQSRAGYSAGYAFGGQLAELQRQSPGVELEAVFRGILDALSGTEPRLSADERRAALEELEGKRAALETDKRGKTPQLRARGRGGYADDFAALNARREGVVTLPSGVQYEVLQAGSGKQPGADDAVLVSYQGSLTNGAVFDSTYKDGEPARLQLAEIVVPGLKEALLMMNEGAKWRVVIPPSMGFKTAGNNMLRRRDLIYEIELVAVETSAAPAAAPPFQNTPPAPDTAAKPTASTPASPAAKQH